MVQPLNPRLILASASPRRAELLRAAGFQFDVVPATVDEQPLAGETPRDYVQRLAALKSAAVARQFADRPVLGADTAVVLDKRVLGKPVDEADAAQMLRMLAGRTHDVLTGVSIRLGTRHSSAVDEATVRFSRLDADEIAWYVASGEPAGKAGAYAIQGCASRFIDWIEGSYTSIVGLPVAAVYRLLRELGVEALLAPRSG